MNLSTHLEGYGLRHFVDDSYWTWGGQVLGEKVGRRLNKLRKPIQRSNPKKSDLFAFYDFIADPVVASVVHSMKTDAIRACGQFVAEHLKGSQVLDVGCNIGYLTTWYATVLPNAAITGVDMSPNSISLAKTLALRLPTPNVTFVVGEATQSVQDAFFDEIVDTQGVLTDPRSGPLISGLLKRLKPGGRIYCIPSIGIRDTFISFMASLREGGAAVVQASYVTYRDLGEPGAYPALVLTRHSEAMGLNDDTVMQAYDAMLTCHAANSWS